MKLPMKTVASIANILLWIIYVGLALVVCISLFYAMDNFRSTGDVFRRVFIYMSIMPFIGLSILSLNYFRLNSVKKLIPSLVILVLFYCLAAVFFYGLYARTTPFQRTQQNAQ